MKLGISPPLWLLFVLTSQHMSIMDKTHFPFHSLPRDVQLMIVSRVVSDATHVKDGLIPLLTLFDVDEMDVDILLEFLILWRKKDEDDPFLIHTVHIISARTPRVLSKIFTLWNSLWTLEMNNTLMQDKSETPVSQSSRIRGTKNWNLTFASFIPFRLRFEQIRSHVSKPPMTRPTITFSKFPCRSFATISTRDLTSHYALVYCLLVRCSC